MRRLAILSVAVLICAVPALADTIGAASTLAPHRAIYDVVNETSGVRSMIAYEFRGDSCSGYATSLDIESEIARFRQTLFEDADGKKLEYAEEAFVGDRKVADVAGVAERSEGKLRVRAKKSPINAPADFSGDFLFPVAQDALTLRAALSGDTKFLSLEVFSGPSGVSPEVKPLSISVVWTERKADDAAPPELKGLRSFRFRESYFEESGSSDGVQQPLKTMDYDEFENGVSTRITVTEKDNVSTATLRKLELLPAVDCASAH